LLIAEHKSLGKNLDAAYAQAIEYASGLSDDELPRYIVVSDFQRFQLYDHEADKSWSFELSELRQHPFICLYDRSQDACLQGGASRKHSSGRTHGAAS
ncbi:MAG: type IIL restriction-modification enzyme MmeI, partial [Halobacteriota archaeon]